MSRTKRFIGSDHNAPLPRSDRDSFERMLLSGVSQTADRERKAYTIRRDARRLADALVELGVIIRPLELPEDMAVRAMKLELARRTTFFQAATLGVGFTPNERPFVVESRMHAALPEILEAKGMIENALIHKNFGNEPEAVHKIITVAHAADGYATLEDIEGSFGTYDYRAVNLALHATLTQSPATQK